MAKVMTLAETLAAVLCHDLSSPLSTILGALELAQEDPAMAEEAMALAREAAARMGRRLRLLRAAWGGDCGPLSREALLDLLSGLPPRVTVSATGLHGEGFDGPDARVVLNAALLAVEALPRGGVVSIAGDPASALLLQPAGAGAVWPAHVPAALLDPQAAICDDVRIVQAPLSALLAHAAGRQLRIGVASGPAPGCPPLLLTRLT